MNHSGSGEIAQRGIGLDDDRLYRALTSTRRRRLLYVLLAEQESTAEELATVLTGWESTEAGGMATPAYRREVLVDLTHHHLPCLADAGLIEHDRECGSVEIGALDEPVVDLITRSIEAEQ